MTGTIDHRVRFENQQTGSEVLMALVSMAQSALAPLDPARARVGRLRGTGPGVSFTRQIEILERDHPRELEFPFEGSERVGGASWLIPELLGLHGGPSADAAVAKLRWRERAADLPMHVHEHSDRCIIVLDGRGFFHVSEQELAGFDGTSVRTIAARQHDVFVFTRGVVHTFSTASSAMTLISVQLPFLRFDDPRQYTLPRVRWLAQESLRNSEEIAVGGWEQLAG